MERAFFSQAYNAERGFGQARTEPGQQHCPRNQSFGLSMTVDGNETWSVSEWNQSLDMKEARHVTEFVADSKVKVRYSFAALRNLPYSMIMDVEVSALEDAAVEFSNRMHVPQEYCMAERERKSYWIEGKALDVLRTSAKTAGGRYDVAAASAFILDVSPSGITGASADEILAGLWADWAGLRESDIVIEGNTASDMEKTYCQRNRPRQTDH